MNTENLNTTENFKQLQNRILSSSLAVRLDKLRSDIERINKEIEDLTKHHGAKIEIAIGGIVKIGTSIKHPYIQIQRIE